MNSQIRTIDGRLEMWLQFPLPGGWVCAEPDDSTDDSTDDGMCGMPVESEPCSKHWPLDVDEQDCSHRDDPGHDHEQCLEQHAASDAVTER